MAKKGFIIEKVHKYLSKLSVSLNITHHSLLTTQKKFDQISEFQPNFKIVTKFQLQHNTRQSNADNVDNADYADNAVLYNTENLDKYITMDIFYNKAFLRPLGQFETANFAILAMFSHLPASRKQHTYKWISLFCHQQALTFWLDVSSSNSVFHSILRSPNFPRTPIQFLLPVSSVWSCTMG